MSHHRARSIGFARLVLLVALAAGGCAWRGAYRPSDELLLRTYTLPEERGDAALQALTGAVRDGSAKARVEKLPDGRVLVVAPAGIHEGVESLLRGFAALPVRSAELDYWIVLGEPGAAQAGPSALSEIAPALQEIVAKQGAMKFTLLESSRLSSMLDESASAQGDLVQVRQVVSVVGGVLTAEVTIDLRLEIGGNVHHRNLQSRINFRPGILHVLGQSGYTSEAKAGETGPHSTVFYILRGEVTRGE